MKKLIIFVLLGFFLVVTTSSKIGNVLDKKIVKTQQILFNPRLDPKIIVNNRILEDSIIGYIHSKEWLTNWTQMELFSLRTRVVVGRDTFPATLRSSKLRSFLLARNKFPAQVYVARVSRINDSRESELKFVYSTVK